MIKHESTTTRSQLREGNQPGEGRLQETDGPMNKNRIPRPTRHGELAQHSKAIRSTRGGKCGGRVGTQRALTWGDPGEEMPREVSKGIVPRSEPGAQHARRNQDTGSLDVGKGRTEQERYDPAEDTATDHARRRGSGKRRRGGDRGAIRKSSRWGRFLARASRPE